MDGERFDQLARAAAAGTTRRGALRALAAALAPLLTRFEPDEAAAEGGRRNAAGIGGGGGKKRRKRHDRCRPRPRRRLCRNRCGRTSDGCGGHVDCGGCGTGEACRGGRCVKAACTPDCAGKQCGADGCGGSCGRCRAGETCREGRCAAGPCRPNCAGKQCGPDGCGGTCGDCPPGQQCRSGRCEAVSGECASDADCGDCQRCDNKVCVSACQTNEVCRGGRCLRACQTPRDCGAPPPCRVNTCEDGVCGTEPRVCPQCQTCDPNTRQCVVDPDQEGAPCEGDACTRNERCREGVCVGEPVCTECETCNAADGTCSVRPGDFCAGSDFPTFCGPEGSYCICLGSVCSSAPDFIPCTPGEPCVTSPSAGSRPGICVDCQNRFTTYKTACAPPCPA